MNLDELSKVYFCKKNKQSFAYEIQDYICKSNLRDIQDETSLNYLWAKANNLKTYKKFKELHSLIEWIFNQEKKENITKKDFLELLERFKCLPKKCDNLFIDLDFTAEYMQFKALLFFKKEGVTFSKRNLNIDIIIQKSFRLFDKKIEEYGSGFLYDLLQYIKNFMKEYELYYFPINLILAPAGDNVEKIYPIGLLFKLGLKYFRNVNVEDLSNDVLKKNQFNLILEYSYYLLLLSKNYISAENLVQLPLIQSFDLIKEMQKFIFYNQCIKIEQYRAEDVLNLVKNIDLKIIEKNEDSELKSKSKLIVEIFECSIRSSDKGIFSFKDGIFYSILSDKYTKLKVDQVLNELSYNYKINNFNSIQDAQNINFMKPFVKIESNGIDKFYFLEKRFFSLAFLHCISDLVRGSIKEYDKKVGDLIEKLVENKLKEAGYKLDEEKTYSLTKEEMKKHNIPSKELEFDAKIILEKAIVFIEMKKKFLTQKAKSGDALHILYDISLSLLTSQLQAVKHKIVLQGRNNKDDEKVKEVRLVSLSLVDFDTLHSPQFVKALFSLIIKSEIAIEALPEYKEKICEINKILKKLHERISNNTHIDLMLVSFLNYFHFIFMMDFIKGKDEVAKNKLYDFCFRKQNSTVSSFDFYFSFDYLLNFIKHDNKN